MMEILSARIAYQLRLRRMIDHPLQVVLAKRGVARGALDFDKGIMLFSVEVGTPFHRILRADKSGNGKGFDPGQ